MKILMVNKFLYPRGGAETYMLKIGAYFQAMGHEVQYFGMYDEKNVVGNRLGLYAGNKDFHESGWEKIFYPFEIIYSFRAKKMMTQIIKDFQPDVIHLNNINFQLTPSIVDAGAACHVPMVQTAHDFQMLCPNHLMLNLNTKTTCEICVTHSKMNCIRYNCIHHSKAKSIIGALEGTLYRYRKTYDKVTRYLCPSHFMEQMLQKHRRYNKKTQTIHNFIELKDVKYPIKKKDYVLYFGRLAEEKGLDRFLAACRMCPEISFIIAGSGPLEPMCAGSGLSNVNFVGFQTGEALKQLIQEAVFSVYLPIWYENCPLSVLESESLGTPVLCNRIGGIPELVEDGKTGVLLDTFTPEIYAQKMKALYADKALLAQMSENCLKKRPDMISLDRYCQALYAVYEEIIV